MSIRTTGARDSNCHKGCLLFRATDFASLMRPIMFWSWIFGFFPCSCNSEECVFSKKKFIYSVIAACLHLVLQIYNFLLINILDTSNSIMQSMSENFFVLLDGSTPLMLSAAPFSMTVMFGQLLKLSRTLSRQDFSDMAKVIHTVYIVNLVYYILSTLVNYKMLVTLPVRRRYLDLYLAVASTMPVLCYVSCVRVLGACLKKLNENLKHLNGPSPDHQTEMIEKQLSRRQSTMLLTKVKYYEEVHEKISDAVEQLNTLFRTANIIFTTSTFLAVTFDFYTLFATYYSSDAVRTTGDMLFMLDELLYAILKFGLLCVMIWFCETAANHAADITTTIYDCISYCADDIVKRELKYFGSQVMHRDITFTTKAFDINGKLLSQILGAIFMYMMILYQFLMSSNCTN